MRKHKTELIILFVISAGLSILLQNFAMANKTFVMPNALPFAKWTLIIFVGLTLIYFAKKGKPDEEPTLHIPNGFHELYNDNNQITKKGYFEGGKLYNGSQHIYKKDGTLSHIEIYKEGNLINQ